MKKSQAMRFGIVGICAAMALALSACGSDTSAVSGPAKASGTKSVTILYSRAAEQVGVWVAQDEGFFKKNGLDVKLSEAADATQVATGISGGSADMGYETGPDFLSAVDAGVKLVVASGLSIDTVANPRVALIASKKSGITKPADVAGKRIAVPGVNTSTQLSTIRLLEQAGVDVSGIKWIGMPFQQAPDALKANRVDAAVSVYPFIGLLKSQGNVPVFSQYAQGDEKQLVVFLSASGAWVDKNPDGPAAVRKALDEANAFVVANPDKTRLIMQKYTGLAAEIINKIPFPTLSTEVTTDQLSFFLDIMKKQKLIKNDIDLPSLIAK